MLPGFVRPEEVRAEVVGKINGAVRKSHADKKFEEENRAMDVPVEYVSG